LSEKREQLIYLNGKLVPREEAKVSVYDHGFLYGDGVFEGIRAYDGRIFKLDEHVDRLYDSAKAIMLDIPMSKEEMKEAIIETVRANELRDAYIRVVVSRGEGDLGLDPEKCEEPTVVIIAEPMEPLYGDLYEKGIEVITASVRRIPPDALDPKIKSCNYLNNILAKIQANLAGADEAIMLDHEGYVCEGTGDNVFVVEDGVVYTPPEDTILRGITRATVMELCEELGIPVEEKRITLGELYSADEVFLTGTAAEVAPVRKVDGRKIGEECPGPITRKIMEAFRELTRKEGTPVYEDEE